MWLRLVVQYKPQIELRLASDPHIVVLREREILLKSWDAALYLFLTRGSVNLGQAGQIHALSITSLAHSCS